MNKPPRPRVDEREALQLADEYVQSRRGFFTREAVFTARLNSGGMFLDGLQCRIEIYPDGSRRVSNAQTGELLAESEPAKPLRPRAATGSLK